jgi:hypothetical protein
MSEISVLAIYDEAQVRAMKETFKKDFDNKCLEDKKLCWENNRVSNMTPESYRQILTLLEKCGHACQVEAMNRLVLRDNIVPIWADVEALGNRILTERLT